LENAIKLLRNEKVWKALLALYILLFAVKILRFDLTKDKLQIGDFLFLGLCFVCIFHIHKIKNRRLILIDKGVLVWLSAHIITCLIHPTKESILECVGTAYLASLYAIINIFWRDEEPDKIRLYFFRIIGFTVFAFSILGIIGYILAVLGFPSSLVSMFHNYPYFGSVYRLTGWTIQPIMASSILSVFLLFIATDTQKTIPYKKWLIVLGSIALILTLSKSNILFFACLMSVFLLVKGGFYRIFAACSILFVNAAYLFATHFVLINKETYLNGKAFFFLDKQPITAVGDTYLLKTGYAMLKEKGLDAFFNNPIFGIGSGNLNLYSFYPNNKNYAIINKFDPHSSITGVLGEMGLIGFLALIFLFFSFFKTISSYINTKTSIEERFFSYGLFCILIYMICEGFCADVMNFRHYWLFFAFMGAYYRPKNLKILKLSHFEQAKISFPKSNL
jgi:O-Antigen ligase